jgi:hypothetical protein
LRLTPVAPAIVSMSNVTVITSPYCSYIILSFAVFVNVFMLPC